MGLLGLKKKLIYLGQIQVGWLYLISMMASEVSAQSFYYSAGPWNSLGQFIKSRVKRYAFYPLCDIDDSFMSLELVFLIMK